MDGMQRKNPRKHTIDVVVSLVLFCVFAVFAVTVLLIGVRAYRGITQQMNCTFDSQTVLSYIANKVRQNDTQNGVQVGELDGIPALVLSMPVENSIYDTYIYFHEGSVKEMLVEKGYAQAPETGLVIAEGKGLGFSQEDGLVWVSYTSPEGETRSLCLSPRSEQKGAVKTG